MKTRAWPGQLALVGCNEQRWCGGSVAGVGVLNNTASNGIVVKSGKQNENERRITSLQECLPLRSGRLHADQRLCHCLCFLRRRHCPFPTVVRPTARLLLRTLPSSQKFNSLQEEPDLSLIHFSASLLSRFLPSQRQKYERTLRSHAPPQGPQQRISSSFVKPRRLPGQHRVLVVG